VKNTGGQAITAQAVLVGARDPNNANVDFPGTGAVTLQPGQQYTYSASRSFAVKGTYTDWPVWFDGTNWNELAAHTTFTVGDIQTPGTISLVTPLALNPASPGVNAPTNATFTVQNSGGQAVTVQFIARARDPNNANVDFPGTASVTLQPGQQYGYSASRSFAAAGTTYTAWPSYFDGTNWIELAAHTSF